MSYDIYLKDRDGKVIEMEDKHHITGGTYCMGGTRSAHLNITYNCAPHFYRTMGEKGIRELYGQTAEETIPLIRGVINQLSDDTCSNYWEPTEGNAKVALENLLTLAKLAPRGVWDGD